MQRYKKKRFGLQSLCFLFLPKLFSQVEIYQSNQQHTKYQQAIHLVTSHIGARTRFLKLDNHYLSSIHRLQMFDIVELNQERQSLILVQIVERRLSRHCETLSKSLHRNRQKRYLILAHRRFCSMLQFAKIHTYFDLVKIIFSEVRCLRKKTYFCKLIMRKESHKTLL